ncbi:MAG: DUF5671 domain-containing protein [Candidatus Paceibacterota bacterium]
MENHTAKHFALQLGSLASLYLSIAFLLVLIFGVINLLYPDTAEGYWAIESAASGIRTGLAMVLVFFPTYLVLTRLVNKSRRTEREGTYLTLTKWLIYLSLLLGGAVLLGDLVAIIMAFLEGGLTTRFLLKALAVVFIVGPAFYYYVRDAKGYWVANEQKSVRFAGGATLLVLTALAFGFNNIESPTEVRERKIDEKQIIDLQDLQYRVINYYEINSNLPQDLNSLPKTSPLPQAPESRQSYEYKLTDNGFALCAEFAYTSNPDQYRYYSYPIDLGASIKNTEDWSHAEGSVCFERVLSK